VVTRIPLTLDDLKTHAAFITLSTDQQREWVVAYCTNGADKIKATEAAYACNDTASAVAIANRNLRHPAIKRLVNDFYGMVDETGSRDEFLAILWKRFRDCTDDKAKLGWAQIYMKVKGYEAEKPEPADSPVDSVDDLVRQLEAQGKV
jgi:hypothetical protein